MSKGWTGESSRHAMARMGIKTGTKKVSTYNVPKRDGSEKGLELMLEEIQIVQHQKQKKLKKNNLL